MCGYYTEYGTKELMYEFDELNKIKNPRHSLAPIFHRMYSEWISKRLPKDGIVTDLDDELNTCVVDGKLVKMRTYSIVFSASLYLTDYISVEGNDMNACKKLMSHFRSFVKQQKLEEIITDAKKAVVNEDMRYLGDEVCSLYGIKSAL